MTLHASGSIDDESRGGFPETRDETEISMLPAGEPKEDMRWKRLTFHACSFLRNRTEPRTWLVRRAMQSWKSLLRLPFANRVFLDDRSDNYLALRIVEEIGLAEDFDELRYGPKTHPKHSNFGIVGVLGMGGGDFLLHLDDDVEVRAESTGLRLFLEEALDILLSDPRIMGINLLQAEIGTDWGPRDAYRENGQFSHPLRYFGTAASIIRKELLERVPLKVLEEHGSKQPEVWEKLISGNPREFLVSNQPTPFYINDAAWLVTSTADVFNLHSLKWLKWRLSRLWPWTKRAGLSNGK